MASEALGLLECKGLVCLIEGSDAMLPRGFAASPGVLDVKPHFDPGVTSGWINDPPVTPSRMIRT